MISVGWSVLAKRSLLFTGITLAVSFGLPHVASSLNVAISQSFSNVVSQLSVSKSTGLGESTARKNIQKAIQAEQ